MIIINLSFLFSQSHFKKLEVLVRSNPLQQQPSPTRQNKTKPNCFTIPVSPHIRRMKGIAAPNHIPP